jgi:hypothetical protein
MARFWNNRFNNNTSDEVLYLRNELVRARQDVLKIIEQFTIKSEVEQEKDNIEYKPITSNRPHWRVRAAELERESREKKAQIEQARTNSTTANTVAISKPVTAVEELLPVAENQS